MIGVCRTEGVPCIALVRRTTDIPRLTGEILAKALRISGFGILSSATVQDPVLLQRALEFLGTVIHMPHFKTAIGGRFRFQDVQAALESTPQEGGKALLVPG